MSHPESKCERCGGPNFTWFAPNEIWNAVMPDADIVCPVCFATEAARKGFDKDAWKLTPEFHEPVPYAELLLRTLKEVSLYIDSGMDYTAQHLIRDVLAKNPSPSGSNGDNLGGDPPITVAGPEPGLGPVSVPVGGLRVDPLALADDRRNWPEDFGHENGDYQNQCVHCGQFFIGYKRRVVCRVCAAPEPVQGEGLTLHACIQAGGCQHQVACYHKGGCILDVLPMAQRGEYQGGSAELTAGNPLPLASRLECLYDELHSLGWHSYAGWVREAITALEARVEGVALRKEAP